MSAGFGQVRLGPAHLHGSTLVLRPPRFSDFAPWQRLRLRDQGLIEPFWHSSPLSWEQRHTEKFWVRECLEAATAARTGRRLAKVIEIDGRFAGQVEIGGIDSRSRQGEMGIWIDADLARHGFGGLAAALALDFGFDVLGLERVIAPISPRNVAAAHGAAGLGYVREARMALHFDVGGARSDHDLWALARADVPSTGFAAAWTARALARNTGPMPTSMPLDVETPSAATVVIVSGRYRIGQLWRAVQQVWPADRLRLPLPGYDRAVLRSPYFSDGPASGGGARHRFTWWREFLRGTAGARAPDGLLLVIDIDGGYAGQARLFDLDMFDRSARMHIWADAARADDAIRTAAIRALVGHAFEGLGLCRVATNIPVEDTGSAAVAAKAGLMKEGTMRGFVGYTGQRADHDLWAITAGGAHEA